MRRNKDPRALTAREPLPIAPVPLQHLDLVAVRILHEEEPRHQRALAVKFLYLGRVQPLAGKPVVLRRRVIDAEGDML